MDGKEKACGFCGTPGLEVGYLTDAARQYPGGRRWTRTRLLICSDCYEAGFDPETGYEVPSARERRRIRWYRLAGRGDLMPATPCANCGQSVIRNSDPLLKRVSCSLACDSSLSRSRNGKLGNQGSGQPCETCGEPITTGRADSRYCGSACRQKAYRQRGAAQTALASPLLDARGRRYPERSQRKALQNGVTALAGLCEAFARTSMLEDGIPPAAVHQWRTDLAEARQIVEALHLKLQDRSGIPDSPADLAPLPSRPATRKNLARGTAALSGLCAGLATVTELAQDITPEVAAEWQGATAGVLAGIDHLTAVLTKHSYA